MPDHRTTATPTPEEVLRRGLEDRLGRPAPIASLRSERLGTFSTHPIRRLRATLEDGQELSVIFKRLVPKPGKDTRRELLIYRRLLPDGRFGAPTLYASLRDDARDTYWLFLEDVTEWKLEYCPANDWPAAFRWMAGMHAHYHGREQELRALGCLGEHDARFYRDLARDARKALRENGGPRALDRFDGLTGRWLGTTADHLSSGTRTLVHGDVSCHNLIVQPGPRIRSVDWEWAAIGPAAWDVTKLLDGWGGKQRGRLLSAYLDAFERSGGRLDRGGFRRDLGHCEIVKKLWYLRWWVEGCEDPAYVDRLLDKMGRVWEVLEGEDA